MSSRPSVAPSGATSAKHACSKMHMEAARRDDLQVKIGGKRPPKGNCKAACAHTRASHALLPGCTSNGAREGSDGLDKGGGGGDRGEAGDKSLR